MLGLGTECLGLGAGVDMCWHWGMPLWAGDTGAWGCGCGWDLGPTAGAGVWGWCKLAWGQSIVFAGSIKFKDIFPISQVLQ